MRRPHGGGSLSSCARSSNRLGTHVALIAFLSLSPVYACDCKAPPVPEAARQASAVFTGKVVERRELAPSEFGRRRYQIRFSVAEIWKGADSKELTVYDQNPQATVAVGALS